VPCLQSGSVRGLRKKKRAYPRTSSLKERRFIGSVPQGCRELAFGSGGFSRTKGMERGGFRGERGGKHFGRRSGGDVRYEENIG